MARIPAFDVAVIGGGPAGVAAALALTRAGLGVALVERTGYQDARIGETLPPHARPLLASLGMSTPLEANGHMVAPGILAAWGSAEPHCNDFIVNPWGNGWHLDRARFDRMLAAQARGRGVKVYEGATVAACEPEEHGWQIVLTGVDAPAELSCRFIVDATGRRTAALRRRAARRTTHDRLIGIAAFTRATHSDRRTLIEATQEGWWYSALLPGDLQVAVYMTDADMIVHGDTGLSGFLRKRLHDAPLTRERCGSLDSAHRIAPFAATTSESERVHGRNWLLAGDAATAWDPLSGQGICKALESGMRAARAIHRALAGDDGGLHDYAQWTRTQFAAYLRARARYYRAEQRWPQAAFWRRRHLQGWTPAT